MFFFEILSINRNRNFLNFLVLVFLVIVSLLILPSGISASDLTMADKVIIEECENVIKEIKKLYPNLFEFKLKS